MFFQNDRLEQVHHTEHVYEEIKDSNHPPLSEPADATTNTVYVTAQLPTIPPDDHTYSTAGLPTIPPDGHTYSTVGLLTIPSDDQTNSTSPLPTIPLDEPT